MTDNQQDLLNLINGSVGAAGWLIVMTVGILIAEIIAIVIAIVNIQPTVKLIFGIIVSSDLGPALTMSGRKLKFLYVCH